MTGGMMYFPRMLDKIRLHDASELPEDYTPSGQTQDGGRRLHEFPARELWGSPPARAQRRDDEEILEWCYANGRRLNEGELLVWNGFASKLGWNDLPRRSGRGKQKCRHS